MEYLNKVLGIEVVYMNGKFEHLPNFIVTRYRLQRVYEWTRGDFPLSEDRIRAGRSAEKAYCPYTEKREPACRAGAKRTQLSSKGISAS